MSDQTQRRRNRVRLYACGGGGTNIGSQLEKYRGSQDYGFAELDIAYIDTSNSNIRSHIDTKHCYLIDGLDGSGKIRAENYEEISGRIRDVLQQFKPGDLNIVLSTAAGGSGSVIAPSLVGELLSRDIPTIVVTIGSSQTRIDAENTLKTLKSYESVARLRKAPVVMTYLQNSQNMTRAVVDTHVEDTIVSLCALFSGQNHELDSRDLFNWLRFERVTSFQPALAALTLLDNQDRLPNHIGNVISVATLANHGDHTDFPVMPEYQCVGYLSEDIAEFVRGQAPMHFVTSDGIFTEVASELNQILSELSEQQAARISKGGVLTKDDRATDTGMVL